MNAKPKSSPTLAAFLAGAFLAVGWVPGSVWAGIPEPDLVWYGKVLTDSGGVAVRVTSGTLTWRIERLIGGTAWTIATPLTNLNDQFSFVLRVPCETPEAGITGSSNTVFLTSPTTAYRRATVALDGQPLSLVGVSDQFALTQLGRGRPERIDLSLGTLPVDSDGDGLGDAWEIQYFGGLGATPGADPDGDGLSNLREYRAGTNPNDPNSRFEFVEIIPILGGVQLRWSSEPNRQYRLRRSATLSSNPAVYQVIQSNLQATPPINEFVDSNVANGAHYFYLLEVMD